MKKVFMLAALGLSLTACSVENDELELTANEVQDLNATIEVEGCTAQILEFGEAGTIEVINDDDNLYVSIVANEGYSLIDTRLHVANNFQDFPAVGNGNNLPPGQMSFHEPEPDSNEHTFVLNLDDYADKFAIASRSVFSKDGNSEELWVGTPVGKNGNWSYFEYTVKGCEIVECTEFLGADRLSEELRLEEITGWTYEEFEVYVFNTLLEGLPTGGSFEPTLEEMYADLSDGTVPYGLNEAVYTVTVDGCTDSIRVGATLVCESSGCQ